jgi:hypothetical protein
LVSGFVQGVLEVWLNGSPGNAGFLSPALELRHIRFVPVFGFRKVEGKFMLICDVNAGGYDIVGWRESRGEVVWID